MDFETARFNMIEQQIRPWNVLNQNVLDLLEIVKREDFVSAGLEKLAFTDCDLPIQVNGKDTGQTMFSPKLEARILQELKLKNTDKVLEVGTGSAYMAALMASQCAHVTTIEIDPEIAEFARNNLKKNGVTCATVVNGCGLTLAASLGKFDVIVLSGATPVIPQQLLEALNPQGRLIAIAGKAPAMQLVFAAKSPDGKGWVNTFLLETEAKLLSNTPKINEFVF